MAIFSENPATQPPPIQTSSFQAKYDLKLKSKVVSLNGKTLETPSDLNPTGHGVHLTQF